MRYASERLSLFRTVFVQVAALLLFAAGGMLLAVAVNAADFLEAYSQLGQDLAQPRMGEHKLRATAAKQEKAGRVPRLFHFWRPDTTKPVPHARERAVPLSAHPL